MATKPPGGVAVLMRIDVGRGEYLKHLCSSKKSGEVLFSYGNYSHDILINHDFWVIFSFFIGLQSEKDYPKQVLVCVPNRELETVPSREWQSRLQPKQSVIVILRSGPNGHVSCLA